MHPQCRGGGPAISGDTRLTGPRARLAWLLAPGSHLSVERTTLQIAPSESRWWCPPPYTDLNVLPCAKVVLVERLEPARVVVRVRHQVDVELGRVPAGRPGCTTMRVGHEGSRCKANGGCALEERRRRRRGTRLASSPSVRPSPTWWRRSGSGSLPQMPPQEERTRPRGGRPRRCPASPSPGADGGGRRSVAPS